MESRKMVPMILFARQQSRHREKVMATHSNTLAWKIPWTGEPGGLLSMGLPSWTRLKRLSSSSSNQDTDTKNRLLDMEVAGRRRGWDIWR